MSSGSAFTIIKILANIKEGPNDKGCQMELFEPFSILKDLQDLEEIKLNHSDDPPKEFLELKALTNKAQLDISEEILAVFGESEGDSDGELVKDTEVKEMNDTVFLDTPFDNELKKKSYKNLNHIPQYTLGQFEHSKDNMVLEIDILVKQLSMNLYPPLEANSFNEINNALENVNQSHDEWAGAC
ncbi:hypothetical protein BpHYR1_006860 [Brachionus plicatilis]|uniref:Uncharacterized protein n=1 Tax=Brachionus plicatilis TaxID=10195 RepID=A0A3M7P9A0_BRAPC|nr:hypothetical protein BpHYR1_006860 [Brachionus plicatilis]